MYDKECQVFLILPIIAITWHFDNEFSERSCVLSIKFIHTTQTRSPLIGLYDSPSNIPRVSSGTYIYNLNTGQDETPVSINNDCSIGKGE